MDKTVDELHAELRKKGVDYIVGGIADLNCELKGKVSSIENLPTILRRGVAYQTDAIAGLGTVGPTEEDCLAWLDTSRLSILPWDRKYAICPVSLTMNGRPYARDIRALLARQIDRAADMGYRPVLGIEPEFYLLKGPRGSMQPLLDSWPEDPAGVCYDVRSTLRAGVFLEKLANYIGELGWGACTLDHELAPGQYETIFDHCDMLDTVDRWPLFKMMVRHVAAELDGHATFMPKPFDDRAGSGVHLNISLTGRDSGENLFTDTKGDGSAGFHGYSRLALQFTAGILEHADAITALACPTINSYKRLIPNRHGGGSGIPSWISVYVGYGYNVRTVICRLPNARQCVEFRLPDSAANCYLTSAMVLAAGLDGISRSLDPGKPVDIDTNKYSESELEELGIPRVPRSLEDALRHLERSELARATLGDDLLQDFLDIKRKECAIYGQTVTDWEHETYL